MIGVTVVRKQHAVGHGGFHTGKVLVRKADGRWWVERDEHRGSPLEEAPRDPVFTFDYVYDCGSEHTAALRYSLGRQREASERTDALFVSHLHADHVAGIDALVLAAPACTVVAPYLAPEDLAALALNDLERGALSSLTVEYVRDPVGWWRSRGARRIVFIEPDPGGEQGAVPPEPSPPPDEPTEGEPGIVKARMSLRLAKPAGQPEPGLAKGGAAGGEDTPPGAYLAAGGSAFRLEASRDGGLNWFSADWLLLPYVHPVADAAREAFRAALARRLGFKRLPRAAIFRQRLVEHIRVPSKAKQLVDLYSRHFGSDHNRVSMSLYSGPSSVRSEDLSRWNCLCNGREGSYPEAPGWLATGDSALRQAVRRTPFRSFFSRYHDAVGILNLPHHGSIHNFHEDLLDLPRLHMAVATTVPAEERIARLAETFDFVRGAGVLRHVADARRASTLKVIVGRSIRGP